MTKEEKQEYEGIIRDLFAAAALLGMFSAGEAYSGQSRVERAELAYQSADAMLKARNKKKE